MNEFKGFKAQQLSKKAIEIVCKKLPTSANVQAILGEKATHDIRWREISIDVKVARLSKGKWIFNINKSEGETDIVVLIALDKMSEIEKIFVVPIEILPETMVTLSKEDSKTCYDVFLSSLNSLEADISEAKYRVKEIVNLVKK